MEMCGHRLESENAVEIPMERRSGKTASIDTVIEEGRQLIDSFRNFKSGIEKIQNRYDIPTDLSTWATGASTVAIGGGGVLSRVSDLAATILFILGMLGAALTVVIKTCLKNKMETKENAYFVEFKKQCDDYAAVLIDFILAGKISGSELPVYQDYSAHVKNELAKIVDIPGVKEHYGQATLSIQKLNTWLCVEGCQGNKMRKETKSMMVKVKSADSTGNGYTCARGNFHPRKQSMEVPLELLFNGF